MRTLYIMEITNEQDTQSYENIYKFCKVNRNDEKTEVLVFRGNNEVDQIDELFDDLEITNYPMYKRAQQGIGYLAQEASVFRKLSI